MAEPDHNIQKPTLFISHATSDAEFANALKAEIEKVFADGIQVFCTSSPGAIQIGRDWLTDIEAKLKAARATIVVVTPTSIERPWLWFEVGATWERGREGQCRIYPVCAPEIDLGALPSPLDRLQALSMGKAQDLKMLFEALIDQFGFGKIESFRASNITKRIPKYKDVKVDEIDRNERHLYSGKYSGYSDEELMEVIDSVFFSPDSDKTYGDREERIAKGKLIHFREVDREFGLPPETAKRLLNEVAKRYALLPEFELHNVVRYKPAPRSVNSPY
jgi:hypothetical protein